MSNAFGILIGMFIHEQKHLTMETKIQKTLLQWFPDDLIWDIDKPNHDDYEILQKLAHYTLDMMFENKNKARQTFKVIEMLYCKGNLKEKNAIENEFFSNLGSEESPGSLLEHLQLMPDSLKPVYLKTILEN